MPSTMTLSTVPAVPRPPSLARRAIELSLTIAAGVTLGLILVNFGLLGFAIACLGYAVLSISRDLHAGREGERYFRLLVEQERIIEARRLGRPIRRTTIRNAPVG